MSPDTRYLEKHEISTVSEFDEIPTVSEFDEISIVSEFDEIQLVTRFHETILTVKSISSSKIWKNFRFSTCTITSITVLPFFKKIDFFPSFTVVTLDRACRSQDVVVLGKERSLFLCFTMRELGEDNCEKGGTLSHLIPTCNLIMKFLALGLSLMDVAFCRTV